MGRAAGHADDRDARLRLPRPAEVVRHPHRAGGVARHGVDAAVGGAGADGEDGERLGREPIQPFAGGHRLAGLGVVPEAAPVALGLDLLVRDGALDDQHERLQLAALGLEEPLDEVVVAADRAVVEVDQRPVHGDLREPRQRPQRDLLDAGLGGRGEGDRVAVAAQTRVDPQDVDDGILGRCGHRSAPRGVVPITLARCAGRSKWSRHLPTCCIRPTVRRWARGWRGRSVRRRYTVTGVVQGVGFRPFVHRIAAELGLSGFVGNAAGEVFVEVQGDADAVAVFARPARGAGPAARAHRRGGRVRPGRSVPRRASRSCPAATGRASRRSRRTSRCATTACAELFDPADRRYRHPFVTCTNCGPRFTIITGLPYDRPATTMAGFPMCAACAAEYADPADRRFHAQPVCCPDCGPTLTFRPCPARGSPGGPPRRGV